MSIECYLLAYVTATDIFNDAILRSHGVSKILHLHRNKHFYPKMKKWKTYQAEIKSCFRDDSTKYVDFAVIGSGVAGLRYALEVAKHGTVAIITKAEPHDCNTNYAQGGVSAVLCPLDSVESHVQDTIVAGAYLCDEDTVRVSFILPFYMCRHDDIPHQPIILSLIFVSTRKKKKEKKRKRDCHFDLWFFLQKPI